MLPGSPWSQPTLPLDFAHPVSRPGSHLGSHPGSHVVARQERLPWPHAGGIILLLSVLSWVAVWQLVRMVF